MKQTDSAPFPSLRTAYLRAIARAWREPDYLGKLLQHSQDRRGVLDLFEEQYKFKFPFNIQFQIAADEGTRPVWEPVGANGWFGFADSFTVYLPEKPKDKEHEADMLAEYCFRFPTMLGQPTNEYSEAPPDFAAFGVVTSRILALAWLKDDYRAMLYAAEDARQLVQDSMDCIIPWNFTLKFKEFPLPDAGFGGLHWLNDVYWGMFPYTEILVNLPVAPRTPELNAVALAAYNDTGAQYPFTCG